MILILKLKLLFQIFDLFIYYFFTVLFFTVLFLFINNESTGSLLSNSTILFDLNLTRLVDFEERLLDVELDLDLDLDLDLGTDFLFSYIRF